MPNLLHQLLIVQIMLFHILFCFFGNQFHFRESDGWLHAFWEIKT